MSNVTIAEAHRIMRLRRRYSVEETAALTGRSTRTIIRVGNGEYLRQQRAIADRMEYFLGGAIGPGSGNYRTHAEHHPDDAPDSTRNKRTMYDIGPYEMHAPDTLDMLIAAEEAGYE